MLGERDFMLEAAAFFLCEGDESALNVSQQLELLESTDGEEVGPPDGVIVWQPFEYWMANDLLEQIGSLAGTLQRIYDLGYESGKES